MSSFKQFITEIHRRSLWQVLLIYVGGALIAYQAVQALTEGLGLPPWLPGLAAVLFIVGLPIVVATAFVQGGGPLRGQSDPTLIPESSDPLTSGSTSGGARRLFTWRNALGGGVLALALWGVVAAGWLLFGERAEQTVEVASIERKSIAVLPLANLSGDEQTDPFVNGIHDDIVTHLYKIGDLRPISRTSVMEYANTTKNLRQIAEELGVATVLEGGVQRSGDRVRINVQLIDAETDEHIWAEVYEEELTAENVFTIQTDIARRIALALKAQLAPDERERIAARPTDNLEAYEYYLRARAEGSISMLERAVELDPDFAVAWAEIAKARLRLWFRRVDTNSRDSGVEALNRAIDLAPNAFETQMAQAAYHRTVTQDPQRQLEHLQIAETLRPNDAVLFVSMGETLRYAGRWDEALAAFEKAAELDPLNAGVALRLGVTSKFLGRFADAERYYDRVIALSPSNRAYDTKFIFLLEGLGDTIRARQFADQHPEISESWLARLNYVRRDYERVIDFILSEGRLRSYLPKIYYAMNERERLTALADSMRPLRETQLDKAIEAQAAPTSIAFAHARLGIQYAYLGEREAAIREAEKAMETYRVSVDAFNYNNHLGNVAGIYIRTGDHDQAIEHLETMLSIPGEWTVAWLRLDPFYDPLRDRPRFRALLEKYE
jgi:TolB-like protein/Tfp pilus assembly protein PilF